MATVRAAGRAGIAGGYALGLMIAIRRAAGAAAATTFLELDIYGWPRLEDQRGHLRARQRSSPGSPTVHGDIVTAMHERSERALRRGRVVFEVGRSLRMQWIADGATDEIVLPFPWHGYGGHELVVSPDEDYLALYLFSGQSEQGWELFSLVPALHHVGSLPYVEGEGDPPQFSPDGQWLAMLVAVEPRVRDTGDYFESTSDATAGDTVVVDWARLYVQHVPDPDIASHAVGANVPRSFGPDDLSEWRTYGVMRYVTATTLELMMPWHERLVCSLPAMGVPIATYPPQ